MLLKYKLPLFIGSFLASYLCFSQDCIKTLTGHTYSVNSVAFSPDGKMIASGSHDKTINLWSVPEMKHIISLSDPFYGFTNVVFSADGKTLVSSAVGYLIIWDLISKKKVEINVSGHKINSISFSPEGKYLIVANSSTVILMLDINTLETVRVFERHSSDVKSVVYSPDGKFIASGSLDKVVKLWDTKNGVLINSFYGHLDWVICVAYSPDGKYLASGSFDNTIKLWNIENKELEHTFTGHSDPVKSVVFSPDGNFLASGSQDGTIRLWDIKKKKNTAELTDHLYMVNSVSFSPDGKYLASGSEDKTIKIWDVSKYNIVSSLSPPKPIAPPALEIQNLSFSDENQNHVLDANENGEIKFKLTNTGKGDAYNIKVICKRTTDIQEINIETVSFDLIKTGESKTVSIKLKGLAELPTTKLGLKVQAVEGNGFDSDPVEIQIQTQKFIAPKVIVSDYLFSNEQGGQIKLGVPINLKIVVQNIGQGIANEVGVKFNIPEKVFASDVEEYTIGTLDPGAIKELNFEFFANKQYTETTITVDAILKEKLKNYAENKTMVVELNQVLTQTKKIEIKGELISKKSFDLVTLSSDVDKNIPENGSFHENKFALIIGNEDYTSYQSGLRSESNVEYAQNDAQIFKDYCIKTFGVPEKNITMLLNATSGQMLQSIEKQNKLIQATEGKAEIIVYYAGHGLPDEKTKEPYLIPVDVSGGSIASAIKLSLLYEKLTEFPSQKVTVFLDACFSGGGRDAGLLAARSVKITPKNDYLTGNIVVFTASSGEESSLPWKEKQHGMFTYFLLKKFQETKGNVSFAELDAYLKAKIKLESVRTNNKQQSPQTLFSTEMTEKWNNLKL